MLVAMLLAAALLPADPAKPDWRTPFERGDGNTTATYAECIQFYQRLDAAYPEITMREAGSTDSGQPLHEVVVSLDGDADPASVRQKNRRVVFIQNGIHPGEPEGIDASMMLVRDYVQKKDLRAQLSNVTLVVVPVYNVDGMLNRNSTTRVNQNGPRDYGFRGNARNYDLNRDYIKQNSRNARSFAQLFQRWRPEVFVETHTSNGADYQYTMTLIATQKDKLHPALSQYLQQRLLPALYQGMEKRKWPMVPYVDFEGQTPESGLVGFLETPRYSTGYAALFNTIGFMPETHMLKAFKPRVESTYALLDEFIRFVHRDADALGAARAEADRQLLTQTAFPLTWKLDKSAADEVQFRGYEGRTRPSEVSGLPRLYYDRKAPFTRPVKYYNTYRPALTVERPAAYLIPQAWEEVIERLRLNGVRLQRLSQDVTLSVESQYIDDFQTSPRPYEGHYLHSQVKLRTAPQQRAFHRGDYVVTLDQPAVRYLVETLEPQSPDSFFAWGFFDSVLQQKEHFSDYVFEDLAADVLRQSPDLRQQLEAKQKSDPAFAKDATAQLEWVFRHSPYHEPTYRRYPVARWNGGTLPIE
ncbi:M14 family metallopeptidase [Hymenobacter koreensis]|uniref:M14 family metallopeptidase n=2 Tax=Hymenobacter koreensis TaxID=1084523 RepID=A0ABP8J944_9BACT